MISLVLPPLTQLNTPYPSTAYLARFLRTREIDCLQYDLGIEWVLRIFSRAGLGEIIDGIESPKSELGWHAIAHRDRYVSAIEPVISFLQGKDRSLGPRILSGSFLPDTPRTDQKRTVVFGRHAVDDAARHLATGWLADLAELIAAEADSGFALSRYHHQLAAGEADFGPIAKRLDQTTLLDGWLDELADQVDISGIVGISVPFPGNLYGALRIGRRLKQRGAYVILGGGYVNTELRETREIRLWNFVDALTFDDGEGPLLAIHEWKLGIGDRRHRTRTIEGDFAATFPDIPTTHSAWYGNLPLHQYLQLVDGTNPAHRLWSDGRWNKITLAHGCYWKKCSFCDIHLDYISRFSPAGAKFLVEEVAELIETTGQRGFHAVDEAAPPKAMKDFALELLATGTVCNWWGNIRFEKHFTTDLCRLLAASGLIAVTGGLEVASDRLLEKMDKGVTVEQVARVAQAFSQSGVLVHAYLMYGFPTETDQETVDSMEIVRQLFKAKVLKSAFWHRFVLTRHSGIYPHPERFGVDLDKQVAGRFAANDVAHRDPTGGRHDLFDAVLPEALHAWMQGEQVDRPVHKWFSRKMPKTQESGTRIADALISGETPGEGRVIWLGGEPLQTDSGLRIFGPAGELRIDDAKQIAEVLGELLMAARPCAPALSWKAALQHLSGGAQRWIPMLRLGGLVVV